MSAFFIFLPDLCFVRSRKQVWQTTDRSRLFSRDYLRAAQAYMLISMPTGTSTIFGVFQVISLSQALASKWLAR
jgi:hypothetical protein